MCACAVRVALHSSSSKGVCNNNMDWNKRNLNQERAGFFSFSYKMDRSVAGENIAFHFSCDFEA